MKKEFLLTTRKDKAHFACNHIDYDAGITYIAQGTMKTTKGKKTTVIVDFEAKTVVSSNRLFKVERVEFTEVPYYE